MQDPQVVPPLRGRPESLIEDLDCLRFKWFSPMAFFVLFFSLIWNGMLVIFYGLLVDSMRSPGSLPSANHLGVILFILPLGHVFIGIGITYYSLCMFLNQTRISIRDGRLEVRNGPLPWGRSTTLAAHEILQVYVAHRISRSRHGRREHYDLMALNSERIIIPLIRSVFSLDAAKYIEFWIESRLGIRNQEVEGEA